jgi:hypothetical protein
MKPAAWIVVAVAAMVASVAWRFARRSKLAMAIAVVATSLVVFGLVFAAGGWGGCHDRGDCGPVGGPLRVILSLETLLLPVLILFAGARALWRRVAPERKPRGKRPRVRGDAARMRPRDVALGIFGCLTAVFSIVYLVTGQGEERIAALAILLFSAALLLVPVSGRMSARSGSRPRLDYVDGQPSIVIPGSRIKLHLMRVAGLCFAGMGLLMAMFPHALASSGHSPGSVQIGGIVVAALFGLIAIPSMLLARGPVSIELTPQGLRWRLGTKPSSVAWDSIRGVWPYPIRNTWFLGLDGDVQVPKGQRWLTGANKAIAHADASISLEAFPVEPERLAEIIGACAADPGRRRVLGTEASLRWFEEGIPERAPEPAPVP